MRITGTVADLRPYLQQATVAAAPIPYGAGIQNKVLEAMACGAPVVASPQASSALQTQAGRDLLVADNAAGFAANLLQLLDPASRTQRVGPGGPRLCGTISCLGCRSRTTGDDLRNCHPEQEKSKMSLDSQFLTQSRQDKRCSSAIELGLGLLGGRGYLFSSPQYCCV